MPRGLSDQVAEQALGGALRRLCSSGTWQGFARGLAWQLVSSGARDVRSLEMLADAAEAILASLIDEALWLVERTAFDTWHEFLHARPGDEEGALLAARLDATEESLRLVASAREQVLKTLVGGRRRAA
jgi:hypothetical protein